MQLSNCNRVPQKRLKSCKPINCKELNNWKLIITVSWNTVNLQLCKNRKAGVTTVKPMLDTGSETVRENRKPTNGKNWKSCNWKNSKLRNRTKRKSRSLKTVNLISDLAENLSFSLNFNCTEKLIKPTPHLSAESSPSL